MIIINGKSYSGKNIEVYNGRVTIDGTTFNIEEKIIDISIQGNIDKIKVDSCNSVTVTGDVKELRTVSGDVEIYGNVHGDVQTVNGDVDCEEILGSVKTVSGDIRGKKK